MNRAVQDGAGALKANGRSGGKNLIQNCAIGTNQSAAAIASTTLFHRWRSR
jgi:hypothetical protein